MMRATESGTSSPAFGDTEDLLRLARERSAESRKLLVGIVGDLYFGRQTVLTAQECALMTGILGKLIEAFASPIRRSLAERLSRDADAPHELAAALAGNAIGIAGSIVPKSPALLDLELVEIIRHLSLDHQLAIAMRRSLSESVSDAPAEAGHADVIKSLLEHDSLEISEATLAYLVDRSQALDGFQEPILRRRDLTSRLLRKMHLWVSATLRQTILERFAIGAAALDDAIEAVTWETLAEEAGTDRSHRDRPAELARRLAEADRITPQLLVGALRQGEVALFQALLGRLSGLRLTLVRRLLYERHAECLAALFRALSLDKPTFASVFLLTRRARPGGTAEPHELSHILSFFDRTDADAARAAMTRWRRDPEYLEAIRHVSDARQSLERVLQEMRSHVGSI